MPVVNEITFSDASDIRYHKDGIVTALLLELGSIQDGNVYIVGSEHPCSIIYINGKSKYSSGGLNYRNGRATYIEEILGPPRLSAKCQPEPVFVVPASDEIAAELEAHGMEMAGEREGIKLYWKV